MTITTVLILTIVFFLVMLLLGVPVAYAMGISGMVGLLEFGTVSDVMFAQKCFTTMNSFTLMAVPFYILGGELMNTGGITKRLVKFCNLLLQSWRGALAQATVLVNMLMAGFSGSATADCVSIGSIMIPAMKEDGYDGEFAAGVVASASCIGPIIPPSLTMVIYGGITGISIGTLFIAGIIPGILIGFALMTVVSIYCKKKGIAKKSPAPVRDVLKAAWDTKWALIAPVIILGGIATGIFTATEAGIVLCIYAILVGIFAHKEISLKDLPRIFNNACHSMAIPCLIICLASLFGQVVTRGNLATLMCNFFMSVTSSKTGIMVMTLVILFIVGLFMDGTVAMMIFVPVLFPIGQQIGLDPVHYAMIIMITILIGTVTPPVGLQLFIGASIAKVSVTKVYIWPFVLVMMIFMVLCTFVPQIITFLPHILGLC